jgi:phosphoglycerol transferase MdoB-like AlkP superfamily enzyme
MLGFLIKYNYFNWQIFQLNSIYILITKNLVIILVSIISINFFLKNTKRIYITFFIYLLFTLFFFGNLWYNKYFANYLSLADITMGQGIRPFKVIFRQLIGWIDLLFIFEIPILSFLIFFKSNFKAEQISMAKNRKYRKEVLIILLLILVILAGQIYHINNLYAIDGFFELYEHSTSAFVSVYGIAPLYIAEYFSMQNLEQENVEQLSNEKIVGDKNLSYTHKLKAVKNIIVVQLESFDQKIIDYRYKGQEVTPFLNKIKQKSLYFENIYAQHINGSFDAEFSFLTSLYPRNKNYAFKTNDMSEFNSIIKALKAKDYQFLAFHGNKGDFFYRDQAYPEIGFYKFYHKDYFTTQDAKIGTESYLGINDYDFFDQSIDYLQKAKEPFFAFYITVTSHTPFDFYPKEYSQKIFDDLKPTIVKDYFNSVYFTDQAIEHFFESLKAKGLYQDTLFVFYSDHSSDIKKESYHSADIFIMEANVKEPENIPLMIFHPKLDSKTITKTGTHTDIAPTVLDILGYKEKPKGFLGVSLLKDKENPVLFLHETPQILYNNNLFLRMPMGPEEKNEFKRVAYKNEKTKEISLPEAEKERMLKIIDYMQDIMKKNIIKKDS